MGGILLLGVVVIVVNLLFGFAALTWAALLYVALWIGVPVGIIWAALPLKKAGHQGLGAVLGEAAARMFAVGMTALFIVASLKSFGFL